MMPSNAIAEEVNGGTRVFKNLAGDPDADTEISTELTAASIEPFKLHSKPQGEVPATLVGFLAGWKFERRWYYYSAKGPGIPPERAIAFDATWGKQVRVDGDCACRGAEFWGKGFAIGNYHIDTLDGLKAFADLLRTIYRPRQSE